MQYYMHINGQQVGPFDESLLMLNGLTPTTPVWADGMTGWMPANQVAALSYLFAGQVPPSYGAPQYGAPQYAQPQSNRPMPPTNLVWGILVTIFCCLPFGIVSIVKASQVTRSTTKANTLKLKKQAIAQASGQCGEHFPL